MKYLLLNLIILFSCYAAQAQNLVPNPSFEDTIACPFDFEQVNFCKKWKSFSPSPEYFNSCSSNVPINFAGEQLAASGNAYCGLYTFIQSNGREVIGSKLLSPLIIGKKYYASIKVSLADSFLVASNNLGIAFSTIQYDDTVSVPINNQAKVYSASIINDNKNWTIISGSFVADSAYQYIMIGNFFTDIMTDTISVYSESSFYGGAYYYIDDICISIDSLDCDLSNSIVNHSSKNDFRVYPNPCNDFINVSTSTQSSISIYNTLGQRVYHITSSMKDNTRIAMSFFPNGLYIIQQSIGNNIYSSRFLIKHTP